jgi:hypothetical protein
MRAIMIDVTFHAAAHSAERRLMLVCARVRPMVCGVCFPQATEGRRRWWSATALGCRFPWRLPLLLLLLLLLLRMARRVGTWAEGLRVNFCSAPPQ